MRRSTVMVLLAAPLLFAGCSSPTDSDEQNRSGDAEKAAAMPTTSKSAVASIEQFASLIAEHKGDWDDQVDTTKENCLDPATIPACVYGYMTLGLKADTMHLVLTGAHQVGNPTYVGEPPAEIRDLLSDTEDTASKVNPAVGAFQQAGCADPMDNACLSEYLAMDSAVDELSRKLDAWAVY